MHPDLYQIFNKTNIARSSRDKNAQFVLSHPELFQDLLEISFNINDKIHIKACWTLQLVVEANPELLFNHLNEFCHKCQYIEEESALRSIAKIVMIVSHLHVKDKKSGKSLLNDEQKNILIEMAFDKIINQKTKVASKVYFIRALYFLGKESSWIHTELKPILEQNYSEQTAAFKAVARELLKKIK